METKPAYHFEKNKIYSKKLEGIIKHELPPYCREYFIALENRTQIRTRLAYAYDLQLFFYYIQSENPLYSKLAIRDIPFEAIKNLDRMDFEEYMHFLRSYEKDGRYGSNGDAALSRRLSSLRSFFTYLYDTDAIASNPVTKVQLPKRKEQPITVLESNEVDSLLSALKTGDIWNAHERAYHEKTGRRDYALFYLLLNTGIRVSEAEGLNIDDVDFVHNELRIIRKGGRYDILGLSDAVKEVLTEYINSDRLVLLGESSSEKALFVSGRGKRLSVRAIQAMTEKIGKRLFPMKHITPHKMRSTFGTAFQEKTGDIFLTAAMLGHSDVNTTRKHYVRQDKQKVKEAFRSFNVSETQS
ncbi:MAG: tyrosine-type recombinase/integrase [Lachnospiraceae bacterium]|nr:tyrosine-type recombinase/integrase [Lachnospiraceae bacterium]